MTIYIILSAYVLNIFTGSDPASSLLMVPLRPGTGGCTTLPVSLCKRCTQTACGYPGAGDGQTVRLTELNDVECLNHLSSLNSLSFFKPLCCTFFRARDESGAVTPRSGPSTLRRTRKKTRSSSANPQMSLG